MRVTWYTRLWCWLMGHAGEVHKEFDRDGWYDPVFCCWLCGKVIHLRDTKEKFL